MRCYLLLSLTVVFMLFLPVAADVAATPPAPAPTWLPFSFDIWDDLKGGVVDADGYIYTWCDINGDGVRDLDEIGGVAVERGKTKNTLAFPEYTYVSIQGYVEGFHVIDAGFAVPGGYDHDLSEPILLYLDAMPRAINVSVAVSSVTSPTEFDVMVEVPHGSQFGHESFKDWNTGKIHSRPYIVLQSDRPLPLSNYDKSYSDAQFFLYILREFPLVVSDHQVGNRFLFTFSTDGSWFIESTNISIGLRESFWSGDLEKGSIIRIPDRPALTFKNNNLEVIGNGTVLYENILYRSGGFDHWPQDFIEVGGGGCINDDIIFGDPLLDTIYIPSPLEVIFMSVVVAIGISIKYYYDRKNKREMIH